MSGAFHYHIYFRHESYYKERNVTDSVCALTPPPFMDQRASNLAGRPGMGTERTLRDPFPWQPPCCHGNKKKKFFMARSGLWFDLRLPVTSQAKTSHHQ